MRPSKRPPMPGQSYIGSDGMKSTITSRWNIDCTLRQGLFGSPLEEMDLIAQFQIRAVFGYYKVNRCHDR